MATNCSFINATEARNTARNNTTIWEEICEIQTQILGAIDGNLYSVLVNDDTPFTETQAILDTIVITDAGAGYDPSVTTAVINDGGTGGVNGAVTPVVTGTTITGFIIDNGGSGYVPVVVTATLQLNHDLTTGQTQVNYDGLAGDGTYLVGGIGVNASFEYAALEVITLSENSTVRVDTIDPAGTARFVLVAAQTQVNYDGAGNNGPVVSGGSNYAISDTITLVDGTVITVDSVSSGAVVNFTVTSSSTNSNILATPRGQLSTSGGGTSFQLIPGTNNETAVGAVANFTVTSAGVDPFFLGSQISQSSSTPVGGAPAGTVATGLGFALQPTVNNASPIAHAGVTAVLTPIESGGSIINVTINIPGTSYVIGQPVLFAHPSGTSATASVASIDGSGAIINIIIINAGSGYEPAVATVTVTAPGELTPAVAFTGTVVTANVNASNDYTSGLAFAASPTNTITRTDGTSFVDDGFLVGQTITVSNAEDSSNNGEYIIVSPAVTATVITVDGPIAITNAADTSAELSSASAITGISIQEGGVGYAELLPTATITDDDGTGATLLVNLADPLDGTIDTIDVVTAGSGYTNPSVVIVPAIIDIGPPIVFDSVSTVATATATAGTGFVSTSPPNSTPTDYFSVFSGLTTDVVISDQLQYILDYFTALGYNIRIQTNSTTTNTIQWQIIW